MENDATGMPVDQAAAELGVPADALRLYVAAHKLSDPSSAKIPDSQVTKLKEELRSRAGALRLDDLAKTALTIEWLAAAAVDAAKSAENFDELVASLDKRVSEVKGDDSESKIKPLEERLESLEGQAKDATTGAVQMVGSIQGMVESQGRELDQVRSEVSSLRSDVATLRSDIASMRVAVHALESRHHSVVAGLRAALDPDGESAGKAKARATEPQPTPAAETKLEVTTAKIESVRESESKPIVTEPAGEDEPGTVPSEGGKFVNMPAKTAAKFRVKREIEYNFLLERMGFRRLDSYTEETEAHEIKVPNDDEICAFLCKYELGCEADEVEMVSVQRGEYQMVQYQRIDKASGLRSWITRGRT